MIAKYNQRVQISFIYFCLFIYFYLISYLQLIKEQFLKWLLIKIFKDGWKIEYLCYICKKPHIKKHFNVK